MALLELKGVTAGYGDNMVLRDYDLSIEEGRLVSLLGPSGCGKSTTLRLIAGFSEPASGTVTFDGEDFTRVPPNKRGFGFVFQSYALFPHMTIFDNVAFGLRMRGVSKSEIASRVPEILSVVDLAGYEARYPRELSGGQRQRVALARALVIRPRLLLMDEPLSNLDAKLRVRMRVEIRRIQQELGITTLYVTHDQEECFAISDEVAIMNDGAIEQMGDPESIYRRPRTEFVMNFVGFENRLELTRDGSAWRAADGTPLSSIDDPGAALATGFSRPDDVQVHPADAAEPNSLPGRVSVRTSLGRRYQYNVATAVGDIVARSESGAFGLGDDVRVVIPADKLALLAR